MATVFDRNVSTGFSAKPYPENPVELSFHTGSMYGRFYDINF